jgi:hypothetical protein
VKEQLFLKDEKSGHNFTTARPNPKIKGNREELVP